MTLNYTEKIDTNTVCAALLWFAGSISQLWGKKCNPMRSQTRHNNKYQIFQTAIITHIKQQLKTEKKVKQVLWICGNIIMKFSRQEKPANDT